MAHDPLAWIVDEMIALERQGLRRRRTRRNGRQGAVISNCQRQLVNFASNDYLALAADPRLIAAAHAAAEEEGWGEGASPLMSGYSASHVRLEEWLAELLGTEAALVMPSGFATNVGAICALVGRGDAVFSDSKNHASLIDGCRLSRAEVFVYPHADCGALEEMLAGAAGRGRKLIVTDSLFSMDGDVAPLTSLVELAERFEAILLVDEAHATGVFGRRGSGLVEQFGLAENVHVRVGTLSKALGSAGGFVAGRALLIDWLVNRARPYIFSTAHPAAASAAATAALGIVATEPWRREQLLASSADLRSHLSAEGWNIGNSTSQIIPLIVGQPDRAMRLAELLLEGGIWAPGIRPPSVPDGESLVRLSVSAGHTPQQLESLKRLLATIKRSW
ncbi:MAG TPA: 8-amino-7-oxononanoate synthase [Pirellulales bacterium]|jgi:8-amino-7-oxononanoate synthase|nr:8-amino-7-oxononanoate synthase [Pirellulales bacterium]